MKKNLVYILFFIGFITFAQQNVISVETDTTTIKIGEQIQYKISVNELKNVLFPKLQLDSLGKVEVVEDFAADTLKNKLEKRYLLTSFDSGVYVIPQQEIYINNIKHLTDSLLVNVATVKVDTAKQKMFTIKSIKREPKTFDDYKHWLWWLLPIVLLIALVLFFFFRKKEKKPKVKVVIPPIQEALQRLKELDEKELLKEHKIKAYYTELTDIARTYIEKDIKIPALESTTNELIETITDFNESSDLGISKETIKQLHKVLKAADLVKFAKSKPIVEEIKEDRFVVEDIIKNAQSAVFTKRQESQPNSIIENPLEIPVVTPKKKSNILKYVIIIIAMVIVGLGTVGYFSYKYAEENIIGNTASEMMKKQWYTSSYGYPAVNLQTPEILQVKSVNLPDNGIASIGDFSYYDYGSLISSFYVGVTTINFISQIENFDIDTGLRGGLKEIQSKIGAEFTSVKKEEITFNGIEGRKVVATYTAKNKLTQQMTDYEITMLLFADTNAMQQVQVGFEANDNEARQVKDRIIKSVAINR